MNFVIGAILVLLLVLCLVLLIDMIAFLAQEISGDVFRLKEWINEKRGGGDE